MRIKKIFGLICLLFGAGLLVSCLAIQAATPEADGAAIFSKNCVMCHAADGKGYAALKTPDFTDPKWQASIKDEEIRTTIKNGKKGTAMKAFGEKLTDDEITAVIGYIRSLDSSKKQ